MHLLIDRCMGSQSMRTAAKRERFFVRCRSPQMSSLSSNSYERIKQKTAKTFDYLYVLVFVRPLMPADPSDDFDVTKTTDTIRRIVEDTLNVHEYQTESINRWTQRIVELCQQSLMAVQKSFRTIVTALILPKRDAHVHISNGCLWDFVADGSTIVQ